jgi:hypothetical protein
MSLYTVLSPDRQTVTDVRDVSPTFVQALIAASNPKALRLRPVNMTEQPAFDPNTQRVVQTRWTVGPTDV